MYKTRAIGMQKLMKYLNCSSDQWVEHKHRHEYGEDVMINTNITEVVELNPLKRRKRFSAFTIIDKM